MERDLPRSEKSGIRKLNPFVFLKIVGRFVYEAQSKPIISKLRNREAVVLVMHKDEIRSYREAASQAYFRVKIIAKEGGVYPPLAVGMRSG